LTEAPATGEIRFADNLTTLNVNNKDDPKSYANEPDIEKIKMVLNWLRLSDKIEDIMSGKQQVQNITELLTDMHYNRYLRIVHDIDLNLIKVFLSETSWMLLQQFKTHHFNDGWICPSCKKYFQMLDSKWKCSRCLFFYHSLCAMGHAYAMNNNTTYLLCGICELTV
jgi:rubredoxin